MNQSCQAVAAVSCSMPLHAWEQKRDRAKEEIVGLAQRLSVGSGSGIGKSSVHYFAKEGATVIINDLDMQKGQETVHRNL
jgi:hypothetical protein